VEPGAVALVAKAVASLPKLRMAAVPLPDLRRMARVPDRQDLHLTGSLVKKRKA